MNLVYGGRSLLWLGFIRAHRLTWLPNRCINNDTISEWPSQLPHPRGSPNESDMTPLKKTRRATVRRLKSVVAMCFLSLLHLKPPHDGCPTQYNHTTRMSGSFDTRRTSGMSGSWNSQRTSTAFGSFDSSRMSGVYSSYGSRRASKICECWVVDLPTQIPTTPPCRMAPHSAQTYLPKSSTLLYSPLPSSLLHPPTSSAPRNPLL